jgi:MFS family permease
MTTPDDANVTSADDGERWTSSIGVHYETKKPLRRFVTWYLLLSLCFSAVWAAVNGILMPNQIQILSFDSFFTGIDAGIDLPALTELSKSVTAGEVAPTAEQARQLGLLGDFEAARASSLALVTTTSGIIVMILQPVIGVFSDRTRSKLGRRAPWILYAGLLGAVLLAAVRFAPSVAVIVVLWSLTELLLNVAGNPLGATIADRVPRERRGGVTSWTSLGTILGGVLGGIGAGILFGLVGLDFYLILALIVAIAVVLFVTRARDRSSVELAQPRFAWGAFLRGYVVALRARDYRWLWISRVLFFFGYSTSTVLSIFMLQSYITPALSIVEASATAPLLSLAGIPAILLAVSLSGRLSDKLGRRKPFVVVASVVMAASMAVPLVWPTLPALFVQAVLTGFAFGIYLPVDNALFIDVLPDPERAGRDLGLSIVATNLGQSLAPVLAAQVVLITGGYRMVWAAALLLVGAAALTIWPVREGRAIARLGSSTAV